MQWLYLAQTHIDARNLFDAEQDEAELYESYFEEKTPKEQIPVAGLKTAQASIVARKEEETAAQPLT